MLSNSNRVIIASAGSGKTTFLVNEALSRPDKRIAVLTYTNNNIKEITNKFYQRNGGIPERVDVMTWFSFLLRECARPYQRSVYSRFRLKRICFQQKRSAPYINHSDTEQYYFSDGEEIYSDKIARFVIDCETNSKNRVTKRLADIYDDILIDELQDLAGWDLDLLRVFLAAGIRMVIVGDPRQCTYTTNNAARNSQYRGIRILDLVRDWEASNLCQIMKLAKSYRCNQKICDFADKLWPGMEKTVSHNSTITGHDGIFVVPENNLSKYVKRYKPVVLRYDRRTRTTGYRALNFGNSKGLEFERVLIFPHGPIKKYLRSGNLDDVSGSLEKFYVAVTRAKHSVAFLYDGRCSVI